MTLENRVEFTHLFTGKPITIVDKTAIMAVFHSDAVFGKERIPGATWISVDRVPEPIPVKETHDEVLVKLGLKEKATNE